MDSIWTDLQTDEWANRQTDGRMDRLQIMSILGNRNRLNRSRTVPEPFLNRNRPDQRFGAVRFSQFGLNRVGPNRNHAGPNRGNTSYSCHKWMITSASRFLPSSLTFKTS